jgi:asparagine synthase (glutamine-hydrolysing)
LWTLSDVEKIASEIKAFLPFGWQAKWDVQSIKDVGWLCDRRTLFQGVHSLNPGHYLTLTSFNIVTQHKYWDHEYKDKVLRIREYNIKCTNCEQGEVDNRSEGEMIQGVRDRLFEAIRDRLRADVPIGVFLSGGIDSSALAGMVTHLMNTEGTSLGTAPPSERINCFSVKFIGEEHDEERKCPFERDW